VHKIVLCLRSISMQNASETFVVPNMIVTHNVFFLLLFCFLLSKLFNGKTNYLEYADICCLHNHKDCGKLILLPFFSFFFCSFSPAYVLNF
jgi:hypothetical protein